MTENEKAKGKLKGNDSDKDNDKKSKSLSYLRDEVEKMTLLEFAKKFNVSESAMKSYIYLKNPIPIELAVKFTDEYKVSLDWIYERSEYKNSNEFMLNILLCLEKVFKIKIKKFPRYYKDEKVIVEEPILCVAKEFSDYLRDIQQLECDRSHSKANYFDDSMYSQARINIQKKHKDYLMKVFENFDDEAYKDNDVLIGDSECLWIFSHILQNDDES